MDIALRRACSEGLFRALFFVALLFLPEMVFASDSALSYIDLIHRLTDLEYLAAIPSPHEQCAQWSSYDRKSRYDAAADKYISWDANGDGDGIIRKEGDKLVLAEMEGPGCIWRIWSATPAEGHVRIYLDGSSEPAVDLPFKGYFDGKNAPFTRPALVHTVAHGWNNYTPIPYQKSCKVIADPGWGLYYHFTYGTFPKGMSVPTFKRELSAPEAAALDEVNDTLTRCAPAAALARPREKHIARSVKLVPGKSATLANLKGEGRLPACELSSISPPRLMIGIPCVNSQSRFGGMARKSPACGHRLEIFSARPLGRIAINPCLWAWRTTVGGIASGICLLPAAHRSSW